MTMMVAEVYDAFVAAGTPEEKAVRAAQAVANFDGRFNKVEVDLEHRFTQAKADTDQRFDGVDERFDQVDKRFNEIDLRFAKIEADLNLLKWMIGLVVAGIVALITKSFF